MMNKISYVLLVSLLLTSCGVEIPDAIQSEMVSLPDKIDYNFHIKPILSDRCFACHGPDAQKREGDLRLDIAANAYAALKSGNGKAIIANNIGKSQLVHRILAKDTEISMPPPESNLSLSDSEKALLIKWIEQGATYKPHWAFTKPKKSEIPTIEKDWAINEIDHFIADKLAQKNIMPAREANREQLIRRLYFDLTGLPPNLTDLDRWMKDTRPNYYEELVDYLLASPAYGERMTAHWLDVARFADSEGYLDDFHHTFWPWRDWVIQTFNDNLPYDDFIEWQIGGDQIPNATEEQKLATAFNRHHKQNSEGGVIPEEFRVEYVADRTNTVGTAFMGLTVGCARCHDHKYDPFSQKNYYELFSFFNSIVERGDGIFSHNAIEYGQMVPNEWSMNAGPVLPLPNKEVKAIRDFLLKQIAEKQENIKESEDNNRNDFQQWTTATASVKDLEKVVQQTTVSHLTFDKMADGKDVDLVKGNKVPTYNGDISSVKGKFGQAIRSEAYGQYVADGFKSAFERTEPFTISFWINIPKPFDRGHVLYNGNNRIQGYRGWDIVVDSTRLHFRLNHAHPYQSLDIRTPTDLPLNEWLHFVWTYDGSSNAEGMRLYQNGLAISPDIQRNYLYRSAKPYMEFLPTVYMGYKGIIIGNRHYDQDFTGGLLDDLQILNKEAADLVALYLFDKKKGKVAFEESLAQKDARLDRFYDLFIDKNLENDRIALRTIQNKEVATIDTVQEIMVMGDFENARPTFVLNRGVYDEKGEPVKSDVPNSLLEWPENLPRNRYGLSQWLTHQDHPLTARVAVNQFWYLMFGKGIVETVEDFGNQGALPSHPELLDWLAVDFMENDWDVKRLIRQMVSSATYRQSAKIRPELQEIDPNNNLLARSPRYRRSAEMIRDNILATSGLLEKNIGGPSAFPYQPDNLWKEAMTHAFFPEYAIDYENGLYRRSIYTFWKRLMPPPNMLVFDAATRGECQVRRQRSNTPLQALVLLNDPQMIEGCRVLAEKMWRRAEGDIPNATNNTFRLLTSRQPNDREQQLLLQQYEEELAYFTTNQQAALAYLDIGKQRYSVDMPKAKIAALARVTNTILNSTEGYYKN